MTLGIIAGAIIHGGTLVQTVSPYSEARENLKGQTLNTFGPLAADSKAIERAWKSIFFKKHFFSSLTAVLNRKQK